MSARSIGTGNIRRVSHGVSTGTGQAKNIGSWHYAGNDDTAAVAAAGFFNSIADDAAVGDVICCSLDLDGTPMLRNYMVTAIAAGVVTVAAQNVA